MTVQRRPCGTGRIYGRVTPGRACFYHWRSHTGGTRGRTCPPRSLLSCSKKCAKCTKTRHFYTHKNPKIFGKGGTAPSIPDPFFDGTGHPSPCPTPLQL